MKQGPNPLACSSGYSYVLFKVHSTHCLNKAIQCENDENVDFK